ncbi:unnamed protein product, partial [Mesorhabditis belari]|uniref:DAGKc domain-containing protein n=1 Tax=Mesorhabditis belari TaxID=2138241 RepID=A0AAF3FH43_9BILA
MEAERFFSEKRAIYEATRCAAVPFVAQTSSYAIEMGGVLCGGRRVHDETPTTSQVSRPTGRLLIFVNPHSGAGKGLETFNKRMVPLLKRRAINYELIVTSGAGQVERLARERSDLTTLSAVIILSGDGLVFELLNGLCARDDGFSLLRSLPLGLIPTGSGNGLLASCFSARGYSLSTGKFLDKALKVATSANSVAMPVNLLHMQTDSKNLVAFLSFGWGLLADIDIESERWRKTLGSSRFVAGALIRVFNLRTYRGRLSYLPYRRAERPQQLPTLTVHPHSAGDRIGDRAEVHRSSTSSSTSTRSQRDTDSAYSSTQFPRVDDSKWKAIHLRDGVPNLEDALTNDWVTLDDEFVFVYAMTKSHIATDGPLMPGARVHEDRIHLSYALSKDVTKFSLVRFLLAIEKGTHVEYPFFKVIECSAFRLEPLTAGSFMVIDGEVVETRQIQATTTHLHTHVIVGPETV